ncbi:MAG: hypothetical protein OEZ54_12280 [Gemmatimonadota bacterium]|nr:hypothetical protein [Gemmatimonadota bacterium]
MCGRVCRRFILTDPDLLIDLVSGYREAGQILEARRFGRLLESLGARNPKVAGLLRDLDVTSNKKISTQSASTLVGS